MLALGLFTTKHCNENVVVECIILPFCIERTVMNRFDASLSLSFSLSFLYLQ